MSLLDSTRKDFEALLGNQEISGSCELFRKEKSHSSKRHTTKLKKQKHKEDDTQPLELVQITSPNKSKRSLYTSSSEDGEAYLNQLFWYEDERSAKSPTSNDVSKNMIVSENSVSVASSEHLKKNARQISRTNSNSINSNRTYSRTPSASHSSSSSNNKSSIGSPVSKKSALKSKENSQSSELKLTNKRRNSSREVESDVTRPTTSLKTSDVSGSLAITIHHTDQLVFSHPNIKPMVVVHVVNRENGHYITHNGISVPPQFSASWNTENSKSTSVPVWNQELRFPIDDQLSIESVLLFFDVVSEPSNDQKSQLAWGFLRPISRTGVRHFDKKIQIQLYRLPLRQLLHQSKSTVADLYSWYQSSQKDKYPSTLHITIRFESNQSIEENRFNDDSRSANPLSNLSSPLRRGRLVGQPFRFPTRRKFTFTNLTGALIASYSPNGKLFSFALTSGEINIVGGTEGPLKLKGHVGNVYDLDWNCERENKPLLLSCGADCTARIWQKTSCIVLPHPAYVYSARFGPENRIATASFDQLVRFWEYDLNEASVLLLNSYADHTSPVNCLCWNLDNGKLFSADAVGSICVWSADEYELHFERVLVRAEDEIPINWLSLHPSGNRILVHFRGDDLCLIDTKSGLKLVNYNGVYNQKLKLTSSITPCGSYVVSGSEDGSVYWFDLERGDLVAIMSFPGAVTQPISSVVFHPYDHIMAVCSLSSDLSVVLTEFNPNDSQVYGFSLVTFPRTVQSAAHTIVSLSQRAEKSAVANVSNATPTLDKLERIFRKLDLVMAWSQSKEKLHCST